MRDRESLGSRTRRFLAQHVVPSHHISALRAVMLHVLALVHAKRGQTAATPAPQKEDAQGAR
eukprot:scaffold3323_cov279-Pinguiococcus_pyrenoidosus.AAC.16